MEELFSSKLEDLGYERGLAMESFMKESQVTMVDYEDVDFFSQEAEGVPRKSPYV